MDPSRQQQEISALTVRVGEPSAPRVARLGDQAGLASAAAVRRGGRARAAQAADVGVTARLLKGRENGARLGKHQSGTAPYGYYRDYAARRRGVKGVPLKVDALEAAVVRTIFGLYLDLRSMKKVIERLNASGARTRRGKEWSRAGIAWILKNETYLGRVHFGAIRAKGEHEALISRSVFTRIQRLIRQNDKRGRHDEAAALPAPAAEAAPQ